jgi:hypothetical protein
MMHECGGRPGKCRSREMRGYSVASGSECDVALVDLSHFLRRIAVRFAEKCCGLMCCPVSRVGKAAAIAVLLSVVLLMCPFAQAQPAQFFQEEESVGQLYRSGQYWVRFARSKRPAARGRASRGEQARPDHFSRDKKRPDHFSEEKKRPVAVTLHNLAAVYQAQARHGDVEELYKRALACGRAISRDEGQLPTTEP